MRYAGSPSDESHAPTPFLKPSIAGVLSFVFLIALAMLLFKRGGRHPVEAVSRPPFEPLQDAGLGRYYTVKPNDTLESLARRFYHDSTGWKAIARSNDIREPTKLKAGTVIWIPAVE